MFYIPITLLYFHHKCTVMDVLYGTGFFTFICRNKGDERHCYYKIIFPRLKLRKSLIYIKQSINSVLAQYIENSYVKNYIIFSDIMSQFGRLNNHRFIVKKGCTSASKIFCVQLFLLLCYRKNDTKNISNSNLSTRKNKTEEKQASSIRGSIYVY